MAKNGGTPFFHLKTSVSEMTLIGLKHILATFFLKTSLIMIRVF